MHSTCKIEDGYMGSGTRLRRSIRKHGKINHKVEILEFIETRELLVKREKELVTLILIEDELCMNLKEGGEGGFSSEEHRHNFISSTGPKVFAERLINDIEFRKVILKTLSKNAKEAHNNGKIKYNTFTGKNHSDETKQLMCESHKGKHEGNKNSQYGTCWITKDGVNKKIKKDEISIHQQEGWMKGRKLNNN
jgi:hypothetical protein